MLVLHMSAPRLCTSRGDATVVELCPGSARLNLTFQRGDISLRCLINDSVQVASICLFRMWKLTVAFDSESETNADNGTTVRPGRRGFKMS